MSGGVIVDTGPLVAYFKADDYYHDWSRETLGSFRPPLHTCDAVVSETCFLLRKTEFGVDRFMEFLDRGVVILDFQLQPELPTVRKLLKRYCDVPMSLADACLVRMSELFEESVILTADKDFLIYRRNGRQIIPVLLPEKG